jgi:hypothetical protein
MDLLQMMGVIGFIVAGYVLPELCVLLGSGKHEAPAPLNVLCMASAGLVSASFIIS